MDCDVQYICSWLLLIIFITFVKRRLMTEKTPQGENNLKTETQMTTDYT